MRLESSLIGQLDNLNSLFLKDSFTYFTFSATMEEEDDNDGKCAKKESTKLSLP